MLICMCDNDNDTIISCCDYCFMCSRVLYIYIYIHICMETTTIVHVRMKYTASHLFTDMNAAGGLHYVIYYIFGQK